MVLNETICNNLKLSLLIILLNVPIVPFGVICAVVRKIFLKNCRLAFVCVIFYFIGRDEVFHCLLLLIIGWEQQGSGGEPLREGPMGGANRVGHKESGNTARTLPFWRVIFNNRMGTTRIGRGASKGGSNGRG